MRIIKVDEYNSEARIVEEFDANDPIIQGDHLHNPIFHPDEVKMFVVSGDFYRYSQAELERFIIDAGGKVSKELDIKTNYLVAGGNTADDLALAKKYGITILSEQHLLEFIQRGVAK